MRKSQARDARAWLVGCAIIAGMFTLAACTPGTGIDAGTQEASGAGQSGTMSGSSPATEDPTEPTDNDDAGPVPELDSAAAATIVDDTLAAVGDALSTPEDTADFSDVATGSYLGSIEATFDQYVAEGLTQVGEVRLEDPKILDESTDSRVMIQVCVDSSDVQVLDENGVDLRTAGTIDRALTIFTLESVDGRWVIADETFADDPEC